MSGADTHNVSALAPEESFQWLAELESLVFEQLSAGHLPQAAETVLALARGFASDGFEADACHALELAAALLAFSHPDRAQECRAAAQSIRANLLRPYRSSQEVVGELLRHARVLLARHLRLLELRGARDLARPFEARVADAELDHYLAGRDDAGALLWSATRRVQVSRLWMACRGEATEATGAAQGGDAHPHTLEALLRRFRLPALARDVLVALAAPALDARFMRSCTRVWGDFTRREFDVAFVVALVAQDAQESAEVEALLSQHGALIERGLVSVSPPKADTAPHWVNRPISLRDPAVDWLRGEAHLGSDLAKLVEPVLAIGAEQLLPDAGLVARAGFGISPVYLYGPKGVGKRTLTAVAAQTHGRRVWAFDLEDLLAAASWEESLRALFCFASLTGDWLFARLPEWTEPAPDAAQKRELRQVVKTVARAEVPVVFASEALQAWMREVAPHARAVAVPSPARQVQHRAWMQSLAARGLAPALPQGQGSSPDGEWAELAQVLVGRYRLTPGAIDAAVADALDRARSTHGGPPSFSDLAFGAQSYISHRLDQIAQRIPSLVSFDDLVVDPKTDRQLREMVAYYRNREHVLERWGFERKLPYGRGLTGLFWGPPGTGKTMAAMVLAREFNLELFRVDLAQVVSKYIGETEKNLRRLFDEAERGNVLILFDEADSLFARRTEVKDSIDRYANLEVNFLLQKLEAFEGVAILTTNLASSLDEAFRRRIRFSVEFPFPDAAQRLHLWRSMIPEQAEVEANLDLDLLAEDFELAGGNIKNAVVKAAFRAAQARTPILHDQLREAAEEEYESLGKVVRRVLDDY